MRNRALAIGVAGGVFALTVTASAFGAGRGHKFVIPEYTQLAFRAKSSHGFKVSVSAEPTSFSLGHKPDMPEVDLSVRRGTSSADYVVPGTTSSDGFRARFGHLGEVSVEVASAGRTKASNASGICKRVESTKQHVVFVGRIAFRGEHGYTRLRAHHVQGTVTRIARQSCVIGAPANGGGHGGAGPGSLTVLEADWRSNRSEVFFDAATASGIPVVFFFAGRAERRGRMVVLRNAFDAAANPSTFSFDDALTGATVVPPAPFRGQGTYTASPGGGTGSWSGPLEVDFPGRPHTQLAGPRFSATLSHSASRGSTCVVRPAATRGSPGLSSPFAACSLPADASN